MISTYTQIQPWAEYAALGQDCSFLITRNSASKLLFLWTLPLTRTFPPLILSRTRNKRRGDKSVETNYCKKVERSDVVTVIISSRSRGNFFSAWKTSGWHKLLHLPRGSRNSLKVQPNNPKEYPPETNLRSMFMHPEKRRSCRRKRKESSSMDSKQ